MVNAWRDEQHVSHLGTEVEHSTRRRQRWSLSVLGLGVTCGVMLAMGWKLGQPPRQAPVVRSVVPAEFEQHEAILFAWPDTSTARVKQLWAEIIATVRNKVQVIVAVPNANAQASLAKCLEEKQVPTGAVKFIETPLDSKWVRDFGPVVSKLPDGTFSMLDFVYDTGRAPPPRPNDERVPIEIARALGMNRIEVPLALDGGNLLSNGAGLCVTTTLLLDENENFFGYSEQQTTEMAKEFLGAEELVYLEPLDDEMTGHVDMFAAFTAADAIVVGQYPPEQEPVNAAILDRNAERLAKVQTSSGPLRVYRIPMPARVDGVYATYTNVLFANGTLVMPAYWDNDPAGQAAAMKLYRALLPTWKIVAIDCSPLIVQDGSLHCMSMNLYRAGGGTNDGPTNDGPTGGQ